MPVRDRARLLPAAWKGLLGAVFAFILYGWVAVILHGLLRGAANEAAPSYGVAGLERSIFGGLPTAWLQSLPGDVVFSELAFLFWSSLFWVTPLLCAIAVVVGGPRSFLRLLAIHALVVFSADVVYAIFPTRPPWMDLEVARLMGDMSGGATALDTNPVAAVPSLHVAIPLAYTIWFARSQHPRLRMLWPALAVWTAGISWAVVYSGEHYAVCVVAGIALAVGAHVVLDRILALAGRRSAVEPAPEPRPAPGVVLVPGATVPAA